MRVTAHSQRLMLSARMPLWSVEGGREWLPSIWRWSRALGLTMFKLMFGECISLLMRRLLWSDCVPIWSTQMCERFTLELAHVIFISVFSFGGRYCWMSWISNFFMDELLFSLSLTLQLIKSQQCLSEAELICEEMFLFPSLQTASTWASGHLKT